MPIDPAEFVAQVQPLLVRKDLQGLLALLRSRWTADQLAGLLANPDADARNVAALALSLVGNRCCIPSLADQLKNADPMTNQMAEHALWSIWFRLGSSCANEHLCRGLKALDERDFAAALKHFTRATELDPAFAEAYNQRAIVAYLTERFEDSIEDCQRTVERMPCHFGAWAGLGHCQAHLGRVCEAIKSYKKALEINPHLDGICEAIRELKRMEERAGD